MKRTVTGFTLIELMIVLAIMAVIMTIAIPSYNDYIRRSRRTEAIAHLQNLALLQAKWRAERAAFAPFSADTTVSNLGDDPDTAMADTVGKFYDWSITTAAGPPATYTITATTVGAQQGDNKAGVACDTLTVNQDGVKSPAACFR